LSILSTTADDINKIEEFKDLPLQTADLARLMLCQKLIKII